MAEETKQAVETLVKALKEDPDYRESWKANIAMAFKDAYDNADVMDEIHTIANTAADNFLNILCK